MAESQVALDLSNLILAGITGGTSIIALSILKRINDAHKAATDAQKEAREDRQKMADKLDAALERIEDKRSTCQAENDTKFARKDDVENLRNHVSGNLNAIYVRLRETETNATEAKAYSRGVSETVAALCGDK